jgi:hypothetical protein
MCAGLTLVRVDEDKHEISPLPDVVVPHMLAIDRPHLEVRHITQPSFAPSHHRLLRVLCGSIDAMSALRTMPAAEVVSAVLASSRVVSVLYTRCPIRDRYYDPVMP